MMRLLTKNSERTERFTARTIHMPVLGKVMDVKKLGEGTATEERDCHG